MDFDVAEEASLIMGSVYDRMRVSTLRGPFSASIHLTPIEILTVLFPFCEAIVHHLMLPLDWRLGISYQCM